MKAYYGQSKGGKALVFNSHVGYVRMGAKRMNWARMAVCGLILAGVVGFWLFLI